MHKFNLEIEIPHKDYCNGCPLLSERGIMPEEANCVKYPDNVTYEPIEIYPYKYIRPEICKQNDKEKTK